MLTIFGKKKIAENKIANIFINGMVEMVDKGFPEVAGLINDDPDFAVSPGISPDDHGRFLMIVVTANFTLIHNHFPAGRDMRLIEQCIDKLAQIYGMDKYQLAKLISANKKFMSRINHPSKNTILAMSKAVFFKYDLNQYQEEYFKNLNSPNPLIIKRLKEIMGLFIWDWDNFLDRYKVI